MSQPAYPRTDLGADQRGGSPNFPALEREVLDYWASDDTFQASVARRDGAPEYVFYDGPPFANGLPHYGHLLTGYVKDIVPRYQTMRGYKVERRFGWDTHGLPAELEAERQLGITDKSADRRDGHRRVQRGVPRIGAALHRRVARVRHPPGALGRLRQRLQDARPELHGVGAVGVQDSCGTRAWSTRASACCRTAGATRRRCPTTSCGWTTTSTRAGRTRRSPSGSRLPAVSWTERTC